MKYVKLVPDAVCKTPISVKLHGEGLTERGARREVCRRSVRQLQLPETESRKRAGISAAETKHGADRSVNRAGYRYG